MNHQQWHFFLQIFTKPEITWKLSSCTHVVTPKSHHDYHSPKFPILCKFHHNSSTIKTLLIQLRNFRRQHGEESHRVAMTSRPGTLADTETHSSLIGKVNKTSKRSDTIWKVKGRRKFRATQASEACSIHVTTFRVAKTNPAIDYPWKRLSFDNFEDIIHRFLGFVFICHLLRLRNVDSSISTYSRSTQTPFLETFFPPMRFTFFSRFISRNTKLMIQFDVGPSEGPETY